jgi:hypothetical protein
MDVYQAIKHLHPDLDDDKFVVYDDGTGAVIRKWNADVPKPTDDELKAAWVEVEPIITKQTSDREEIEKLKEYLSSTDFYYIRQMETQKSIPVDVRQKRVAARNRLNELGL